MGEPTRHRFTIPPDAAGERLDLAVARAAGVSRTQAATLIAGGQVTVGGRREKASYRTEPGDEMDVTVPPPPGRDVVPERIPLTIVFEDEHLVVVDKPAGMVVHPAPGNWTGTLVNALLGRGEALADGGDPTRAGLVHRLDKDTSGLLLVAKSAVAHRRLSEAIAQRRVARRYAAMCWGHLDADRVTVDQPINRDPNDRTRMTWLAGGRAARTDFHRLARFMSCDFLRAHLHTGRTHQIRVHLASVGHPVVGDDTYGGGGGRKLVGLPPRRHFLHAAWLVFQHPVTGARIDLRSPLPPELRQCLETVAADPGLIAEPDALGYLGFYRVES